MAGLGVGVMGTHETWTGDTGTASSLTATIQNRAHVGSLRWSRTSEGPRSTWQLGALGGFGTPARYPVRGSVAAGLGLAGGSHDGAHLTVPVELQLGWRLTPGLGLATSAFGNFGGPTVTLGATFGLQVGRLR